MSCLSPTKFPTFGVKVETFNVLNGYSNGWQTLLVGFSPSYSRGAPLYLSPFLVHATTTK